jgi:hypothetical protein
MNSACRCFVVAALLFAWAFAGCANHIPELLPIGNKSVKTGELLEFDVKAKDDDGDPLQIVISSGKPPAARFDQIDNNTATFSWTPIASDAGPSGEGMEYQVAFKVGDGIDTSSEIISIFVTLGGAGTGSPVFITPSDYTLDLDRTNQIEFNIEVRDADSASITLRLVDGIPGGEFSTTGSKNGIFRWTPTEAQINEKPVWGIRVGAKDESNPAVFQDITILLKGGQKKCEGTPPTVDHKSLPDQRGADDYLVEITATDSESEVSAVALYWLLDDGGGGSYQKNSMTTTGGNGWQGTIPNPGLTGDQTATISYYICALDNDDPSGTECDMRGCAPAEGRFVFTAYASGSSTCEDDDFESNDSSGSATEVTFDSYGEWYNWFLKICAANLDYFRMNVPADHKIGAILSYTEANGGLQMDLLDSNGSTVLAAGQQTTDEVFVESQVFSQSKDVYLRVQGDNPQVANNYSLLVVREEFIQCTDDNFEPNNTPNDAKTVSEQDYPGLACCGEPDWYKIDLNTGDKLEVLITFVQENGDLDLWVFDSATVSGGEALSCDNALGCGITETSNEEVTVESIPADGTYYIAVGPYQNAKNSYDMLIIVTPQTQTCQDDGDEPNDAPADATVISFTTTKADQVLCPANEDWYDIYMFMDETIVVDLTFLHANGDLDLKLYDADVTPDDLWNHQVASSVTVNDNELITFTNETGVDATFYLRVYGWNLQDRTTYSLGVTFQ